jgi:CRISPR-associated endonuclease/helicase Cas3
VLKSHFFENETPPYLLLQEHIAQVQKAAQFILDSHSFPNIYSHTQSVLDAIVRCHDLGKGSPAFQRYIENPKKYRGDKREKSHTGLSAVQAILWARAQNWVALDILALIQVVAGHHSGFRDLSGLHFYLQPDDGDVLEHQWKNLNRLELEKASGLANLCNFDDDFSEASFWLFDDIDVEKYLAQIPQDKALNFRLWTQFLFSILLEADKAFLALRKAEIGIYFKRADYTLPPRIIESYIQGFEKKSFDDLRNNARKKLLQYTAEYTDSRCFTLTLPTGAGKTLLAASWALIQRETMRTEKTTPKIIVVLPFLSIIDQTEKDYHRTLICHGYALGIPSIVELVKRDYQDIIENTDAVPSGQNDLVMASHSLSERQRSDIENDDAAEFFLDTWRSEIVITTFDQFLLALFSPKTKHLMRFHHLLDAVMILDEVQTLPAKLWDLVNQSLQNLCQLGNSKILMMSATQPGLLEPAIELAGEYAEVAALFAQCKRYQIHFKHRENKEIEDFLETLPARIQIWIEAKKRVLITVNTRATAKKIWHKLKIYFKEIPVYLISADVTPRDRMEKIKRIKAGEFCLVVSTQTIEAGVDIDMDVVIRDFAPLDSIIQVAGRCNRNAEKGEYGGYVEVISLTSRNKTDAEKIYLDQLLRFSREILDSKEFVTEDETFALSKAYFYLIKKKKDTGKELTQKFAYWQAMPDIHKELRQDVGEQVQFIVADDDEGKRLINELRDALKISDRWRKRSALQKIAAQLNKRTVRVYQQKGFEPRNYIWGDCFDLLEHGYFILNHEEYYSTDSGLDLNKDDPATMII